MTAEMHVETTTPGLASIEACADRTNGIDPDGDSCVSCNGSGSQIWRACPRCGDIAFEYINGHDENAGMRCRLGCGHLWTAVDPGWLAQQAV